MQVYKIATAHPSLIILLKGLELLMKNNIFPMGFRYSDISLILTPLDPKVLG